MPVIDREVANWWTSTSPESRFRQRLTVARALRDGGRLTLLNREFTVRHADGRSETCVIDGPEALLELLAEHFGLHFPAGTRFGPPGSPWPT
jgi:N-hydroxyarylamine O-acetyltransferase